MVGRMGQRSRHRSKSPRRPCRDDRLLSRWGRRRQVACVASADNWALNEGDARNAAWEEWRSAAVPADCLAELKTPEEFDAVTAAVRPEEIDEVIPLISRADQLLDILQECASCGFDEIYIHNVSRDQYAFMDFMRNAVLPELRKAR